MPLSRNNYEYYNTVILGAGMAGLGAATRFTQLGYREFLIVEAQNKPGGRIQTITVDEQPLDIGAQWLHGKDNPLYEIALKHNLLADETSEEGLGIFIRNDGTVLDEFLVKIVDFQIGKILEECQSFVDKSVFPTSVGDYLVEKFYKYLESCDDSDAVRQMKLELFDWHLRFQIVDNSCPNLRRLSAKYWGSYICLDDIAHYNIKGGYQSLLDVIIQGLPKDNSIDKMGFYGIAKIYLFFEDKWWGDMKGFQFLWKSGTVFEIEENWIRHLTGFDEVFGQPNALIGWVGSDGVEQVEKLSEIEVGSVCINTMRKFLPGYDIPEPKQVLRTKWNSNPYVKGSYCHITPECDHSDSAIHKLAEPIYINDVPKIIFAGEAVHPSHYSTTHGAYESGQQQAAFAS
ncbi:hypothetical protein NQ317_017255 [Molorchus minor]|uniref:Amine oxidase domain-containing protein n=1 Tax=Molorchus minor TaxID=1323400 RepID=A0ABQ9J444_9CUCU|nr:hypothetical protein NQ317_017255 [Molorchus minor]